MHQICNPTLLNIRICNPQNKTVAGAFDIAINNPSLMDEKHKIRPTMRDFLVEAYIQNRF